MNLALGFGGGSIIGESLQSTARECGAHEPILISFYFSCSSPGWSLKSCRTTTSKSLILSEQHETDLAIVPRQHVEVENCRDSRCPRKGMVRAGSQHSKELYREGGSVPAFFDLQQQDEVLKPGLPWEQSNDLAAKHGLHRIFEKIYTGGLKLLPRHSKSPASPSSSTAESGSPTPTALSIRTVTLGSSTSTARSLVDAGCAILSRENFSCNSSERHTFCSKYGIDYCLISKVDVLMTPSKSVCATERAFFPGPDEALFYNIRCSKRRVWFVPTK